MNKSFIKAYFYCIYYKKEYYLWLYLKKKNTNIFINYE